MIKSWRHKGLEQFFRTGRTAKIQPAHAEKLRLLLGALDKASGPNDMNVPAWRPHRLKGNLAGHWSVDVNGNWRLTYRFEGTDAILVDYLDTH